jgi:DNA-binding response OmpR family regulator
LKTKIQKDATQSSQLVALKDGYMFDRREKSLYNGEEIIPLTQREKKVMDTLCANVGHVTSIEQIETAVWSDHPAGYAALRSLLFRLRLKLPEGMITNASGSGYKIHQ